MMDVDSDNIDENVSRGEKNDDDAADVDIETVRVVSSSSKTKKNQGNIISFLTLLLQRISFLVLLGPRQIDILLSVRART